MTTREYPGAFYEITDPPFDVDEPMDEIVPFPGSPKQQAPPPLVFVNINAWIGAPVPQREWAVLNRIPARHVTGYSGHGGMGKTITAMMLAAATVLGKDWLGAMPEPGPAIYFSTEDDADEMHRRFARIAEHYSRSISDLLTGGLHLLDYVGKDSVLGFVGRRGTIEPTPLLDQLQEAALDIKPRLFIIDSLADVFAGKENDRAQTRQFIKLLKRVANTADTAVMLIGHPSLTGMNTGTGLSGNTDWHNAPRGRMYLDAATTQKGDEPDKDLRLLRIMKQNYGPQGEVVTIRWNDGVFVPEAGLSSLEQMAADQNADQVFLSLLDRFSAQGRKVSDKSVANNFAPREFANEPEAKQARITKMAFEKAMRRLFTSNKIRVEEYGPPARKAERLARVNAG